MSTNNLLPCPFCGGVPEYLKGHDDFMCHTCKIVMPARIWNRRAQPDTRLVEALEAWMTASKAYDSHVLGLYDLALEKSLAALRAQQEGK